MSSTRTPPYKYLDPYSLPVLLDPTLVDDVLFPSVPRLYPDAPADALAAPVWIPTSMQITSFPYPHYTVGTVPSAAHSNSPAPLGPPPTYTVVEV
ncbi:hypothetical protein JCM8547_003494 [Rhodosporidiobolus lusitaniae]